MAHTHTDRKTHTSTRKLLTHAELITESTYKATARWLKPWNCDLIIIWRVGPTGGGFEQVSSESESFCQVFIQDAHEKKTATKMRAIDQYLSAAVN